MQKKKILIIDPGIKQTAHSPLIILKSFAEIRTGIFNLLERLDIAYSKPDIYYDSTDEVYAALFFSRNNLCNKYNQEEADIEIRWDESFLPWNLIHNIKNQIPDDFKLLKQTTRCQDYLNPPQEEFPVIGRADDLLIHHSANIYPGVAFDTERGPILIDEGVQILPHSLIKGPLYIGKNTVISNARLSDGCVIGSNCLIAGEVVNSIVGDFNTVNCLSTINFSFTGDYVQFGALAGAANLKLDYGKINILAKDDTIYHTPFDKIGVMLADFCSISDKTVSNPGTLLNFGSMADIPRYFGYYDIFSGNSASERVSLETFMKKVKTLKEKYRQNILQEEVQLISDLYHAI